MNPWQPWALSPASAAWLVVVCWGALAWLALWLARRALARLGCALVFSTARRFWLWRLFCAFGALLLSIMCSMRFGLSLAVLAALVFMNLAVLLAWLDGETGYLPDIFTLPLLLLGLLQAAAGVFLALSDALIGALAAYLLLRALGWCFMRWRGVAALGGGDAKFLAALGAWLGWWQLPRVVFFSAAAALLVACARRIGGAALIRHEFAFGPYLAFVGLAVFLGVF